ncbi:MAG: dihydrofolate reductase family protein [Acidobacteriota bacterium]|nr:dihydrofolate reductase family protein [Acidobacteriota bacterium]
MTTLDGVVSFNMAGRSGGVSVSGANEGDRFIMGLLRASADAVMVGAATVGAVSRGGLWTAEFIYPPAKELYTRYRAGLPRKPEHPLIVVVTARGSLDLNRAIFRTPGIRVAIITTDRGREKLVAAGSEQLASTRVHALDAADDRIEPGAILEVLTREYQVRHLLHEGGPTLFGGFLASGFIDELFLTLAPQIAGRVNERPRPGLVEGTAFTPATAPWLSLATAKQAGSHLYLRYRKQT